MTGVRLTSADLDQAKKLASQLGAARLHLEATWNALSAASIANVCQESERWRSLEQNFINACAAENRAYIAERDWWQSKGFKI